MALTPTKQYLVAGAVALAAFIGTGMAVNAHYRTKLTTAQADVGSAHTALAAALTAAKAESAWSSSLAILAASQSAAANRAASRAAQAADSASKYRGLWIAAVKVAPDTCIQVVQTASTLVQSVDAVNSALRAELDSTRASRDSYRASTDSAMSALATLSVPVSRLDTAATTLAKASNEPWLSRIAPKPYIGVMLGVTPTGAVTTAVGIGFGWKL